MTPFEAAAAYLALLSVNVKAAVRFSHEYEGEICQSEEDFDEFLALTAN